MSFIVCHVLVFCERRMSMSPSQGEDPDGWEKKHLMTRENSAPGLNGGELARPGMDGGWGVWGGGWVSACEARAMELTSFISRVLTVVQGVLEGVELAGTGAVEPL